jgi:poly(3-hydroxybutyrate) depolymerase
MPAQEQFFVHVPASYTGAEPYGLVVFTDAGDRVEGAPSGWGEILDDNKLLLVAAESAGNQHPVGRRLGLAVLGALEMKKRYNIDSRRIYAAGFSGGARMSNLLGFYQSDLFRGTIQNCGADFYQPVRRVRATTTLDTAGSPYGLLVTGATPGEIERAKRTVRFVLITGSRDFRRGNILDVYNGGYLAYGFAARLLDVAGMAHDTCDAHTLIEALAFLEAR